MSKVSQIVGGVETSNALETYELVAALKERREFNEKYDDETAVEAIDGMLEQLDRTTSYEVLVRDEE